MVSDARTLTIAPQCSQVASRTCTLQDSMGCITAVGDGCAFGTTDPAGKIGEHLDNGDFDQTYGPIAPETGSSTSTLKGQ